jgi:hypothetical protein
MGNQKIGHTGHWTKAKTTKTTKTKYKKQHNTTQKNR